METNVIQEERFISKNEAKSIVDMLFDNGIFRDDLTRDDLNNIETYLDYSLNTRMKSHIKMKEIFKKFKEKQD